MSRAMNITESAGITLVVLALTSAARPTAAQQPAPNGSPAADAPVRVPRSVLERYVGEYVYPSGATAVVRLEGNTLVREVGGQITVLEPISETRFRQGPVFTAEFVIDAAGGVTKVLSDGVGTEIRIPRKGSAATAPPARPAAPAASAVHVPRSVLERYVGTYVYSRSVGPLIPIVVRLRSDTLTRQISGGAEEVLVPLSETRFRVGATSLEAEFVVDQAGGVTQVMGSGSQQRQAYRQPKR